MREYRLQSYLLLVLLVAATLPSMIVGGVELRKLHHTYQQALKEQEARATALSQEVSSYVDKHARAVRTLAGQLAAVDDPTTLDLQHMLDTLRAEYPGIVGTFLGDSEGNSLVFSPPTNLTGSPLAGQNYSGASYFEPLMTSKSLVYSDVVPGVVINNAPLVTMVAPLLDQEGNVRYYISGGLDLSKLSNWLADYQAYPDEEILLLDNRNTLIAYAGPAQFEPFAQMGDEIHIQKMRSGAGWWESESHVGGYALMSPPNWGVAIITPQPAFYAELRHTLKSVAGTLVLAIMLGLGVAWMLARTMNQPILALMRTAQAVRHGDMEARVGSSRMHIPREMAELHDSFNDMVEILQQQQTDLLKLNATLEERVAERTLQVTRRSEELAVLNGTARALTGVLDLGTRMNDIAQGIVQLVGADVGLVVLRDADGHLSLQAKHAHAIDWQEPAQQELNHSMAARIIDSGQPVLIPDVSAQRHLFCAWADAFPHASLCGVPVRADGTVVGTIVAIRVGAGPFCDHSVDLLSALAGQVGPAISSAWLFAQLQEQWGMLQSITTSIQEGLLLVDTEHRVQFANPATAALLNLDALPPAGSALHDLFTRGSGQGLGVSLPPPPTDAGADGSSVDLELPGPPRRTIAATAFPVSGEGAGHLGYGIVLRNVTQERQLERFKDELLANVSHELRTPLTTILGNAETLLTLGRYLQPSEHDEFVHGIAEESKRLKELIENVLDMSRISSDGLLLNRNPEAWPPLLRQALKRARSRWPQHTFESEFAPALPLVDLDANRMGQVLDNLLNNAAQYSPPGTTVTVRAEISDGGFVQTSVTDQGKGIFPDQLPHVFERFYRGSDPATRRVRGTGLGLAICRGIVEAHGGRIRVDSAAGQGTTVTFTVPVATIDMEGANAE